MTRAEKLGLAGVVLLALLPHVAAIENEFVFDDIGVIVENRAVTRFDLEAIWTSPYWPAGQGNGLFRPLTTTTYAASWAIGGGSFFPFLAVNLLLHAAVCLLLLFLLRNLFPRRPWIVWGGALLFAVHPIHVEAVVGIVGRAETLAALFVLAAALAWLRGEQAGGRAARLLAPLFWLLALLSKEGSIALPGLLLAHRLGWLPSKAAGRRLRAADALWAIAALLALALRIRALGGLDAPGAAYVDNPLAHVDPITRILGACGVLARQLLQMAVGRGFSADYSFAEVRPGGALSLLGLPVLLLLAAGVFFWLRAGRRTAAGYGFAFFLCFWLVTSNVIVPIGTVQADRLLYLPSAGLLVLAVAAAGSLGGARFSRKAGALLFAAAVVWNGAGSAARTADWRDQRSLFEAAARVAPLSAKAHANLAALDLRTESPEAARRVLERIAPVVEAGGDRYGPLLQREAKARLFLGETDRAREIYRRSLARGADSAEVWIQLGNIALMREEPESALAAFGRAEKAGGGKKADHAAIGRASALSIAGRYEEAADAWLPVVAALPDSIPVRTAAAWNLREAGRLEEAASLLRAGIERGDDLRLWEALAAVHLAGGDPRELQSILPRIRDPELREEIERSLPGGSSTAAP